MRGMALVYGHHNGAKSLAFIERGETYQPLDIVFGRSRFESIVYLLVSSLHKNETMPASIVYLLVSSSLKNKTTP